MTNLVDIISFLERYLEKFPGEKSTTALFAGFLRKSGPDMIYTRKNFDGHITTSAFIIDPNTAEILLLEHKSLKRWLQPGGHVDANDVSLVASALREAEEETGIPRTQLRLLSIHDMPEIPFDIDSHFIPENPRKLEAGHYHHDLRYLFAYTGNRKNIYNEEESTGLKWVKFSDLVGDTTFGAVIDKITANFKF